MVSWRKIPHSVMWSLRLFLSASRPWGSSVFNYE
jgi:hypothetical protein